MPFKTSKFEFYGENLRIRVSGLKTTATILSVVFKTDIRIGLFNSAMAYACNYKINAVDQNNIFSFITTNSKGKSQF